ncbi:beta-galactosidase [Demequina sp. SYSU T00192]|uniref:Beta-galactosidase n=1 Tax=Demequina litoralis TaxID=3051660 RepID=A0ABT8GBD1_9MICO|nr:beta-galactosidase [Demequina sp. SYSU T00192]MDN4476456.1 beta-galactosidase [Demequina sp. SYSU T00192]
MMTNEDVHEVARRSDRTVAIAEGPEPRRGHLQLGEPAGATDRIEVTSRWLERAGTPWFPITGEIHFSRIARERWSEVLGHAAAGGLTSVATYVFWQAHEPEPGVFVWEGNRDLRAFVELAAAHGLDVIVRMGPWGHGEARLGGFPDWLVERGLATRTNDPEYLKLARSLYAQIIQQIAGLTHAEGGPVIGAQMDNELYDQPEHLAMLRTIAEELGLRVPIWTATGWGGAQVPETLLPLYSAYSDGFWEDTATEWPAFAPFHFRYSEVRDDLSVGADLREALDGIVLDPDAVPLKDDSALPFATCELGGGMHVAYHRRPLVTPHDVANLALAKVGSGSIWQGYYMYAGGTQRVGAHGTEQESHATGYPNDVPTRTYDFGAPIGEFAQIRPHHHLLRRQHLWLAEDGAAVASMQTTVGGGSDDPDELRWSVRANVQRGYLFLTTYQPAKRPLADQAGVQVAIEFPDTTVEVPSRPMDIPAGVSMVWPLRLPLAGGQTLRSATAEVVTRIGLDDGRDLLVLSAAPGVPVEFVFDGQVEVAGSVSTEQRDATTVAVLAAKPGLDTIVDVPGTRILVLDDATANALYKLDVFGRERLVVSDAPLYSFDGDLVLHSEASEADVLLLPGVDALTARSALAASVVTGGSAWQQWHLAIEGAGTHRLVGGVALEAPRPPAIVSGGPMDRLSAPTDFSGAAHLPVDLPATAGDADRVLLRIDWTGDVGRAVVDDEVVSDHFWHGPVWDIDVTGVLGETIDLQLLPWREATGVWVDPTVRDVPEGIAVKSVDMVRVARVVLSGPDSATTGSR